MAEYERTLIAERMRRGRLRKLQAGVLLPWTRPRYGYRLSLLSSTRCSPRAGVKPSAKRRVWAKSRGHGREPARDGVERAR